MTRNKQEIKGVLCLVLLFVVIIGNCFYIQGETLFYYFPGNHEIWKLFTLVRYSVAFFMAKFLTDEVWTISSKDSCVDDCYYSSSSRDSTLDRIIILINLKVNGEDSEFLFRSLFLDLSHYFLKT